MTYKQEQIDKIRDTIYDTCKDMTAQECTWCQRAIEQLLEKNPDATKEEIIDAAVETLKHNMTFTPVFTTMWQSLVMPNTIYMELRSNLSKLLDDITEENKEEDKKDKEEDESVVQ